MKTRRFDGVEVILIAVAAVLASAHITSTLYNRMSWAPPFVVEGDILNELERKFGPSRHSQGPEEWIVRDFFHDQRNGVFGGQGLGFQTAHSTVQPNYRRLADGNVQITRSLIDDGLQQLVDENGAHNGSAVL